MQMTKIVPNYQVACLCCACLVPCFENVSMLIEHLPNLLNFTQLNTCDLLPMATMHKGTLKAPSTFYFLLSAANIALQWVKNYDRANLDSSSLWCNLVAFFLWWSAQLILQLFNLNTKSGLEMDNPAPVVRISNLMLRVTTSVHILCLVTRWFTFLFSDYKLRWL